MHECLISCCESRPDYIEPVLEGTRGKAVGSEPLFIIVIGCNARRKTGASGHIHRVPRKDGSCSRIDLGDKDVEIAVI